jgi:hypothetical protein
MMDPLHNGSEQNATSQSEDILRKEKHKRLFERGKKWLGAGMLLMGLSFTLNFLLINTDTSFIPFMYFLTSAGATCIVKGLVDIFG